MPAWLRRRPPVGVGVSLLLHLILLAILLQAQSPPTTYTTRRGEPLFVELPPAEESARRGTPGTAVPTGPPVPAAPAVEAPRPVPAPAPARPETSSVQAPEPAKPEPVKPEPVKSEPEKAPEAPPKRAPELSKKTPPPAKKAPAPAKKAPPAVKQAPAPVQKPPVVAQSESRPAPPIAPPEPEAVPAPPPPAPPQVASAPPRREPSPPEPAPPQPPKGRAPTAPVPAEPPRASGREGAAAAKAPAPDIRAALRPGGPGLGTGGFGGAGDGRAGIEGEPIPLDSKDPKYNDYLDRVRRMIRAKWAFPCVKDPVSGQCDYHSAELEVEFGIAKDGRVPFVSLRRNSGFDIMDEYAMNAIKLASPFPPVPDALSKKGIPILATFRYVVDTSLTNVLR